MRYRVTVRAEGVELRGYSDDPAVTAAVAKAMEPFGFVMVSPADDDYDPFFRQGIPIEEVWQMQATVIQGERALREQAEAELRDRELHHFEVEQENVRLNAKLGVAADAAKLLEDNWESGDLAFAVTEAIAYLREIASLQAELGEQQ